MTTIKQIVDINNDDQQQQQPEKQQCWQPKNDDDNNDQHHHNSHNDGEENIKTGNNNNNNNNVRQQQRQFYFNNNDDNNKNNYNSMYNAIKPRQSIRNRRNQRFEKQFISSAATTVTKSYDDSLDSLEFIKELKRRSNNSSSCGGLLSISHSIYMWLTQTITWIQSSIISYLHYSRINIRLAIYFLMIIVAGLIKDYVGLDSPDTDTSLLPESLLNFIHRYIRSSKRSFLNVYFVKFGWFWTLVETVPFILATRFIVTFRKYYSKQQKNDGSENSRNKKRKNYDTIKSSTGGDEIDGLPQQKDIGQNNFKQLPFIQEYFLELASPFIRLALATIGWYFSVQSFVMIAKMTGHCQSKDKLLVYLHAEIDDCLKHELRYLLRRFVEFNEFHRYIMMFDRQRAENFIEPYRFRWNSPIHWIGLIGTLIMAMIAIIWDYMMLQTMFFYHNLTQKILGFLWATVMWFLIYKIITGWLIKRLNVEYEKSGK
ncbi:fat storage-inducing transmembrane protein 2 [Dermatophagoides farinae]|uniref:Fat storage-inducing transmembrane protein 2 n=1 Tax=Dermatophagoides farinae TaxID=6954 RepID=A0A922HPB6_DERFA|nr:fat storage-inducing transmembrane protein 2 [Dermatophagoides farinae]